MRLPTLTITSLVCCALTAAPVFTAVKGKPSKPAAKPDGSALFKQHCARCHGPNGNSIDPRMPALAAQRADWLEAVLEAYRKGARKSAAMSAMSASLGEGDIKALAAHYARQTARPVVYVLVPGNRP